MRARTLVAPAFLLLGAPGGARTEFCHPHAERARAEKLPEASPRRPVSEEVWPSWRAVGRPIDAASQTWFIS